MASPGLDEGMRRGGGGGGELEAGPSPRGHPTVELEGPLATTWLVLVGEHRRWEIRDRGGPVVWPGLGFKGRWPVL